MKAKHTPGPWIVDRDKDDTEILGPKLRGERPRIATVDVDFFYAFTGVIAATDECMANASLIAAAPDLLAALEDIVLKAEVTGLDDRRMGRARAAIAKARGES